MKTPPRSTGRSLAIFGCGLLFLAVIAGAGCSRRHEALNPVDTHVPPVPSNLRLTADSTSVELFWTVDDASRVTSYRIYRSEAGADFRYLATTTATHYTDEDVAAGVDYAYRVAAVEGAVEGQSSVTVSGGPGAYAIVLEGGARFTSGGAIEPGSRRIRVDLVAPQRTDTYRLSEDSTLADSPLFRFDPTAPSTTFQLSAGDGSKTVYAQFLRGSSVLSPTVRSTIILDTHAEIRSVSENSGGRTLGAGDTIHFRVVADSGGTVSISVGSVITGFRLPDDGTAGDPEASDGSYERDLVIPAGMEAVDAVVQAQFTDAAGNQALSVYAPTTVTIADPPRSVSFLTPLSVIGATVTLSWTENADVDFARYTLYRSAPDADTVTTQDAQVAVLSPRDQTSFVDSNLLEGRRYHWGIMVTDTNGFSSPLATIADTTGHLPVISLTSVTPETGSTTSPFNFQCTYSHPDGVAPHDVRLIVDGGALYVMSQVGTGNDWVGGEAFQASVSLARGPHVYHFETTDSLGAASRAPATGDFGGPLVTD